MAESEITTEYFSDPEALLDQLEIIASQPLAERARGFEHLHDALVAALQREDHEAE